MPSDRTARRRHVVIAALAGSVLASLSVLACGGAASDGRDRADTMRGTPSAARHRDTSSVMADMESDMMLHGGCAVESSDSGEPSVELIVVPGVAHRASRLNVRVDRGEGRAMSAELSTGADARTMCGGMSPMIRFAGTAMTLGNPTLHVRSAVPVKILVRTTTAETVAGPVQVKPGESKPLVWGTGK